MSVGEFCDEEFMQEALALAKLAEEQSEVPVGAVLVLGNKIVARGWNQSIQYCDPSAHAEIMALREGAKKLNNYRLLNTTLYVTLEPCAMCAGAILHARVKRVVYATPDPKSGAVNSVLSLLNHEKLNHRVEVETGVCQQQASHLLKKFFQKRRAENLTQSHIG